MNHQGSSNEETANGPRTNGKDHAPATDGSSVADTSIPAFLRELDRWILWREATRKGKRTKIPCGLRHGGKAIDVTQSTNWGTYAEAIAAIGGAPGAWNGPGIVLGDLGDGTMLCGLDLDTCLGQDGELSEWAKRYLAAFAGAYCETSPSNTGLKMFFRIRAADFDTIHRILCIDPGKFARKRVYGDGVDHPPAAELFLSHRFFAVTGQEWLGSGGDVALLPVETIHTLGALLGQRETVTERRDDLGDTTDPDEAGTAQQDRPDGSDPRQAAGALGRIEGRAGRYLPLGLRHEPRRDAEGRRLQLRRDAGRADPQRARRRQGAERSVFRAHLAAHGGDPAAGTAGPRRSKNTRGTRQT